RYKPLKYLVIFNLLTVFVFLTAPMFWRTDNIFFFLVLFVMCQLGLIFGYRNGSLKILRQQHNLSIKMSRNAVNKVFVFYSLTFLIKYAFILRFYPYQIVEMFNFLAIGVASPDIGYHLSLDNSRAFTVPWS